MHNRILQFATNKDDELMDIYLINDYMKGIVDYIGESQNFKDDLNWIIGEELYELKENYAIISANNLKKFEKKLRKSWLDRIEHNEKMQEYLKTYIKTGNLKEKTDYHYYCAKTALYDKYSNYFYNKNYYPTPKEDFLIDFLSKYIKKNEPLYILKSFDFHH